VGGISVAVGACVAAGVVGVIVGVGAWVLPTVGVGVREGWLGVTVWDGIRVSDGRRVSVAVLVGEDVALGTDVGG
jgi:hypothetical protein